MIRLDLRVDQDPATGCSRFYPQTVTDTVEADWDELHEANVQRWYIGPVTLHERRDEWQLYAFDPRERPKVGHRSREWMAVHPTQIGVIRQMAYCLREIAVGRVPE